MPCTIVVFLLALNFDSLICNVEGVYELPVSQEKSHEVVLLVIRYIKDETEGWLGLQGQGEVGPGGAEGAFSHACTHKETLDREDMHEVHTQSELLNRLDLAIPLRKWLWEVCVVLPAVGDAAVVVGLAGCSGTWGEVAGCDVQLWWLLVITFKFHQA